MFLKSRTQSEDIWSVQVPGQLCLIPETPHMRNGWTGTQVNKTQSIDHITDNLDKSVCTVQIDFVQVSQPVLLEQDDDFTN